MANHTDDEFGTIVRAYFDAIGDEVAAKKAAHEDVVDVLRGKPEYAMAFLTSEERICEHCKREDCEWHLSNENDHDCPGFVQDAMFAQMENLNKRQRKQILKRLTYENN
jgi:hypothetical protein